MEPKDKYYIVFMILLLHGIGTLLPWNMLINADSYFVDYKLNITNSSSMLINYRKNFLSYLGIASKAPNILLQLINMFANSHYGSLSTRISLTLIIQTVIFVLTILLAVIDSTAWPEMFFWLTMMSAVVINIANGVYQGCIYGSAAKLPMKYTNSVTVGMNLSGTIAALFLILSIAVAPNPKLVAIYFFSFAVFMLMACFGTELLIKRNAFYMYYMSREKEPIEWHNDNQLSIVSTDNKYNERTFDDLKGWQLYFYVFKKIWVQLFNIILIYFVSLSIFPALQANIKPMNGIISDQYFAPVFCFLFFNLFATLGNYMAQKICRPGPDYLIVFSLLRLLFIPIFLACNYNPSERTWTVLVRNDSIYIVVGVLMALSSGYLSSLCMMYAPRCVHTRFASTAAMMAALTIILGILAGINFSLFYPWIITL